MLERVRKAQEDPGPRYRLSSTQPTVTKTKNKITTEKPNSTLDESLTHLGELPNLSKLPVGEKGKILDIGDELDHILNSSGEEDLSVLLKDEENGEDEWLVTTTPKKNESGKGDKQFEKGTSVEFTTKKSSDDIHNLLTSNPTRSTTLPPLPMTNNSRGLTDLRLLPPLQPSPLSSPFKQSLSLNSTTDLKLPETPTITGKGNDDQYHTSNRSNSTNKNEPFVSLFDRGPPKNYDDDFEDDFVSSAKPTILSNKIAKNIKSDLQKLEDHSLSQEILSELSEDLESSENDDGTTPPLFGMKDLDNIHLVSSDDDTQGEDFNKMTETDYAKRKAEMEMNFHKSQIKLGDAHFVYDKQVEFSGPKMESGWDSDDSTISEF